MLTLHLHLLFFRQETEFGSRGIGAENKNPGNITKIIRVKGNNGKMQSKIVFQKFSSLDAGIEAWFKMIAKGSHYYRAGRFTIEEIIPVYAPPIENPTNKYISNVRKWTRKWTKEYGIKPVPGLMAAYSPEQQYLSRIKKLVAEYRAMEH